MSTPSSGYQPLKLTDLSDPTLFQLNKRIKVVWDNISALYGPGGSANLGANITAPMMFVTGESQPPTDPNAVLTLGAANQLYSPANLRNALLFGAYPPTGTSNPIPSGGVPTPISAGVILEASDYCGGGGLTNSCINNAIAALPSTGGAIHCKTGTWSFTGPVNCNLGNTIIFGDGYGTVFLRNANMPANQGMFDVTASGISIQTCQINGNVTSPTGLLYGTVPPNGFLVSDPETGGLTEYPLASTLTGNTSIWVHGGSNNFSLYGAMVTQTGGYSVILDASTTTILNAIFDSNLFTLNKPHLFGVSSGDINYGTWTGGIVYVGGTYISGTGTLSYVSGIVVTNNQWLQNNGHSFWGYSPQLVILNQNMVVSGNHFQDFGLDGVNVGAAQNVTVGPNAFYRGGYINGAPKYLANHSPVAVDTSGFVRAAKYVGNTVFEINGEGFDLDGLTDSTVSGNTVVNADPSDYYYTADQVASYGATKGINSNSTFDIRGGKNVSITGNTIRNMNYNGIAIFNNRNSIVSGNTVYHPASAASVPVWLGNNLLSGTVNVSGTAVTWVSGALFDTNLYGPHTAGLWLDSGYIYINIAGVTYEILSISSATSLTISSSAGTLTGATFQVGKLQNNTVTANQIFYNAANVCIFEDPSYGDVYGPNFIYDNRTIGPSNYGEFGRSTSTGNLSKNNFVLGTNEAFNPGSPNPLSQAIFQREGIGSTAVTKVYSNVAGAGTSLWQVSDVGPVMNVAANGAVDTGAITTGNRSSFGTLVDYAYYGKDIVDGYHVLGMYNLRTSFYDTEMNSLTDDWGAIRYRRLGGVGTGGVLEASVSTSGGSRVWSAISTGSAAVAGLDTQVQYNLGGTSFGADGNFVWNYTTPAQNLTITGGTVTGTCNTSGTAVTWVSGNQFLAGQAGQNITINSVVYVVQTWNSSTSITLATSAGSQTGVSFSGGLAYGAIVVTDANSPHTAYIRSDGGFVTGNSNSNAIQAPAGGLLAKYLTASDSAFWIEEAAPALSSTGQTRIYMDSTTHLLMASQNGTAYAPVVSSASVAGLDTYLQYNKAGTFGGDLNLVWYYNTTSTPPYQQMVITGRTGASAYPALVITDANTPHTAYVESDGGFITSNTNSNSIQTSGGLLALQVAAKNTAGGGAAANVYIQTTNSNAYSVLQLDTDNHSYQVAAGGSASARNFFYVYDVTNSAVRFMIEPAGHVLVNTTTDDSSGAQFQVSGFISASTGFYTVVTSTSAIQAPNGTVTSKDATTTDTAVNTVQTAGGMQADKAFYMKGLSLAPTNPIATYGGIGFKSGTTYWYWNDTGSVWATLNFGSISVAGADTQLQYNKSNAFGADSNLIWYYNTGSTPPYQQLVITGKTAVAAYAALVVTDANTPHTAYIESDGGFYTPSSNGDAIKVTNGGITASTGSFTSTATNSLQTAGGANVGNAGGSNGVYMINAAVVVDNSKTFVGSGGVNTSGTIQSSQSGSSITFENSNTNFTVTGAGNVTAAGSVTATGGFATTGTAGNIIQAPSGGVTASTVSATSGSWNGLQNSSGGAAANAFYPTVNASSPTAPGAGYSGFGYKSGATFWYYNTTTSAWGTVDLSAVGGITSLNSQTGPAVTIAGTTNQISVSASANTVTLSTPQNINTSASVNFGTVTVSSVFQSSATGASITFQNTNGNFQVDGSGAVSAAGTVTSSTSFNCTGTATNSIQTAGGFNAGSTGGANGVYLINGTAVINNSRQFVGSGGVNTSGTIQSSAATAFQTSSATFIVNSAGTLSAAGAISSTGSSGGVNVTAQTATNSIQTVGGMNVGSGGSVNGVYQIAGTVVINNSKAFVGAGGVSTTGAVNANSGFQVSGNTVINSSGVLSNAFGVDVNAGVAATGFNIHGGSLFGNSVTITFPKSSGSLTFTGGILTGHV